MVGKACSQRRRFDLYPTRGESCFNFAGLFEDVVYLYQVLIWENMFKYKEYFDSVLILKIDFNSICILFFSCSYKNYKIINKRLYEKLRESASETRHLKLFISICDWGKACKFCWPQDSLSLLGPTLENDQAHPNTITVCLNMLLGWHLKVYETYLKISWGHYKMKS